MTNTTVSNGKQWLDTFVFFLESDKAPKAAVPIYLGSIPSEDIDYIYFNCEQLTRPSEQATLLQRIRKRKPLELWDYSQINTDIVRNHGLTARYIHIQSPSWYTEKLVSYRTDIKYDVGFCGTVSPRRKRILDRLIEKGVSVRLVNTWGDVRDKELAQCRIHINIHYGDDYKVFENARCEPWLAIGVPVVSETSYDNDSRCINVDYDALVDTTLRVLISPTVSP